MLGRLALLLTCCVCISSGEYEPQPTALWALPIPAWLREPVAPGGMTISAVLPDRPASYATLQTGDACLRVGGMAPCSVREYHLALKLAALQGDDSGEILRDGKIRAVRLPAFLAWAGWGIDVSVTPCLPPDTLDAAHAVAWHQLPRRVQLAALSMNGKNKDQAWLTALIDLATARPGDPPTPVVPMPDPYLERVAAWWRLCASGAPPLVEDIDEALFRAAHLVWPWTAPASGTISTGLADYDRFYQAWAEGTVPSQADATKMAQRQYNDRIAQLPDGAGSYVGQCLAAISDPENHGGWPYRSWLIMDDAKTRHDIVASLVDLAAREPKLAAMAALGTVCPAVIDQKANVLTDALTTLNQASPWLASKAIGFSIRAGRAHRKQAWVVTALRTSPVVMRDPGLVARLDQLTRQPDVGLDALLSPEGPGILDILPNYWQHGMAWRQDMTFAKRTSSLNNMAWFASCFPSALDPEGCHHFAKILALSTAYEGSPEWQTNTMACVFAQLGQTTDAVFWQQSALLKLRRVHIKREERIRRQESYEDVLARITRGEKIRAGAGDPVPSEPVSDASGRSTGAMFAGKRSGPWTTVGSEGTTIIAYNSGEISGRYESRTPSGSLRWRGQVFKQARIGWWSIATSDGGTANGWYDGVDSGLRCGWWMLVDADGSLRAEGRCVDGRPTAPWRIRSADGSMQPAEPSAIVLPENPALPGASTASSPSPTGDF